MKIKTIILVLFILYWLYIVRFDKLDRFCISKIIKNAYLLYNRDESIKSSVGSKFYKILFGDKYSFAVFTEGTFYNGIYLYDSNKALFDKYESKLAWKELFDKYNIHHPELYYKCISGELIQEHFDNYVYKPVIGRLGNEVKKISKLPKCNNNKDWIVQQMLKDCESERARHYRVITLYTGEIFVINQMTSNDNGIASNGSQGGKRVVKYYNDEKIGYINNVVINYAKKIAKVHMQEFPNIFSIGWDLILNCENDETVPYVSEGNFMHAVWSDTYNEVNYQMIDNFKEKCYEFLVLKGYVQEGFF